MLLLRKGPYALGHRAFACGFSVHQHDWNGVTLRLVLLSCLCLRSVCFLSEGLFFFQKAPSALGWSGETAHAMHVAGCLPECEPLIHLRRCRRRGF